MPIWNAVPAHRNVFRRGQGGWHRLIPDDLVRDIQGNEAVDVVQFGKERLDTMMGACNQFQQRFGIISGNL